MTHRVAGKGAWLWLTAVALSAALATGLAWTSATNSLSSHASRLDTADLALGSVAVTRAGAGQALVITINHAGGTASAESFADSLFELDANIEAYKQLAGEAGLAVSGFGDSSIELLSLLQQGAVDDARALFEGSMQDAYAAEVAFLSEVRSSAVAAIDSSTSLAGSISSWLRIAAVLALPLGAAGIVHLMARRRLRDERSELLGVVQEIGEEAAAADELLFDASHRLRTPLTSVYGLSEMLAQSKRVTGLERELATLVHAEATEMNRVADDVLALTQMKTDVLRANAEIVALPDLVDEATKPAKAVGTEIKVECPEVWVLSDPVKLKHVLRNLVSNAAAHGEEPIFVEVSEVDGRVECLVIDHGAGLPGEMQPDSGVFGAAGHGLEIAYRLSERIGAKLTYSRDGDQTRFCLALADERASGSADPEPAAT